MWFVKKKSVSENDVREIVVKIFQAYPEAYEVSSIVLSDQNAQIILNVDPNRVAELEVLRQATEREVQKQLSIRSAMVILTAEKSSVNEEVDPRQKMKQFTQELLPQVKKVIAVASGKGGVGKSTVSFNIAVSLAKQGFSVGLLDADIYGPSVPKISGLSGKKPESVEDKDVKIEPLEAFGVKVMSIGFFVDEEAPLVWRGPKVQGALLQLIGEVNWGELDYLIIDMPPGTGDVQLTLAQKVKLAGAVIVSTPQDLALADARKGIEMFQKVDVPILGVIENMSLYVCPHCGEESDIFGHGSVKREAEKRDVPFLGQVPLDAEIRKRSDAGQPLAADVFEEIIKPLY